MKIGFSITKQNGIWLAAVGVFALLSAIFAGAPLWTLPGFALALVVLTGLKVELSDKAKKLPWLFAITLIGGGAILTMFSVQYTILDYENFMKTSDQKLYYNVLLCAIVFLIFLIASNRLDIACIGAPTLLMVFALGDYFVYSFRQNEIVFSDLKALGTGLSVASEYKFALDSRCVYAMWAILLYIAFASKWQVKFAARIPMTIIALLLCIYCGVTVYTKTESTNTETWELKGSYRNGFLLNFMLSIRDSYISKPEGYSAPLIEDLEDIYGEGGSTGTTDASKSPVIIAIMSESYSDLSVLGKLRTNKEITPFYNSLSENTIKGYALSSVFGAKTPNSEWEFLSGNTMAFLPTGSVVYQQYIDDQPTTLVSTLKNMGYTTVAMHPYYGSGWSRNKVYPNMGFDETHFIEDFDQDNICREYITDQELFENIIARYEEFEESDDEENLFILGVTMQNHGGYGETYDNFNEDVYRLGLSYTDLNQYLSLLHKSDEALEELITYFESVDQPVEIIFFGDHQPSLNSNFYELMNGKGLSGLTEQELEELYTVPFFIWTNYDSQEETVEITSLNYLSTMALKQAGIKLPAYNQFLSDLQEVVPAINSRGYYSKTEGKFIHVDEATGDEADWIALYQSLQYNSMFDSKNRSNLFFPYLTQEEEE